MPLCICFCFVFACFFIIVFILQIDFDGEIERKVDTGFEVIVIATPDTTLAL